MPTRMRGFFGQVRGPWPQLRPVTLCRLNPRVWSAQNEMESWEPHPGFEFTKGQQLMKVISADETAEDREMVYGTLLYDVHADPKQDHPLVRPFPPSPDLPSSCCTSTQLCFFFASSLLPFLSLAIVARLRALLLVASL